MKTHYYLSPNLKSTKEIFQNLQSVGIKDWFIHVISKDETGINKEKLHSSNYLETLDVLRDSGIGILIGFIVGVFAAGALMFFKPFGPAMPEYVYLIVITFFTLFGIWEGGLIGVASKNRKLVKFQDELENGKYLVLIYTSNDQENALKEMMEIKHPEVQLAAQDDHYLNPFAPIDMLKS